MINFIIEKIVDNYITNACEQDFNHDDKIRKLYIKIAKACRKTFGEDNTVTLNAFLTEKFNQSINQDNVTKAVLSITKAAATDENVRAIKNQLSSGHITANAPCDAMYESWSENDIEKLKSVLDEIFTESIKREKEVKQVTLHDRCLSVVKTRAETAISEGYTYYCPECEEELYAFETLPAETKR